MEENWKIGRLLGEGGFGKVFLLENEKDPDDKNAMKLMQLDKMDEEDLKMALQEIKLLQTLEHEYVLSYVTCFQQDGFLCIVTEFCPNGDLSDYIQERKGRKLEEPRLIEWFRQITSAVEYIHSKNIIHRDLKVANVFLDKDMNCKLGDLGVARILESPIAMAQTQVGTYHYMSPELFMGIQYNAKTDIWSLAVMIFELAALEKPFDANFLPMLVFKVTRGETPDLPTGYRPELNYVLRRMLEKDPKDRPSATQILQDPLFKGMAKPKPMPNLKETLMKGSDDYDKKMDRFAKTFNEMSVGGRKLPKPKPPAKPALPVKKSGGEELGTDPVMELVTRTLTGMGLDTLRPADRGVLGHKRDLLHRYILNVLNNDQELFDEASEALNHIKDEDELEETLIRILGHEKYGMCGVQLLYYKNFSFNLGNMN